LRPYEFWKSPDWCSFGTARSKLGQAAKELKPMSRAPAFQFYPADWLSSPRVTTMTPAEEGAYIRLLCYAWADLDCTIPDDDTELAKLSRLGEGWLNGGSTTIRKCFEPHPKRPGRLFNTRLMEERKKQDAWRRKSREGGKRSAEIRVLHAKEKATVLEGCFIGGSRVVEPQANSSSPSSSSKKKKNNTSLNGHQADFDRFWERYPRKRSKGKAEDVWAELRPDNQLVEIMLTKIEEASRSEEWTKDAGKWIPYPASWLIAKGWEDEYTTTKAPREPVRHSRVVV
jgi:uncharacterized protein YdaU (DUF1376 family)